MLLHSLQRWPNRLRRLVSRPWCTWVLRCAAAALTGAALSGAAVMELPVPMAPAYLCALTFGPEAVAAYLGAAAGYFAFWETADALEPLAAGFLILSGLGLFRDLLPEEARWFRSRILALREADYNIASICLKTPPKRIISRNVVPYLVSLIIMDVALTIPSSIGSEVFLSFIGVGLPADLCTLGNLVNQGRSAFLVYPYQMICPTLILCFITISFYIIGNKFADASDPRNHV